MSGYEYFVYLVREHGKSADRNSAIKNAISDCIRQNVLKPFLEKNSSEIRNMIFTEWNWDDALAVSKEEGIAIGEKRGAQEVFALWEQGLSLDEVKAKLSSKQH